MRLPEYFTAVHSRPPSPTFADCSIRVDGRTIVDPKNDPHFPIFTERSITTTISLSKKRREAQLKRLQHTKLERTEN